MERFKYLVCDAVNHSILARCQFEIEAQKISNMYADNHHATYVFIEEEEHETVLD